MGFANWNGYSCGYNDSTFRTQADFLVSSGLRELGYTTMIIQECITPRGHRDSKGAPQPDPVKFPFGIKDLCDYMHAKGLKCGIYTDVGNTTCAGYEGSYNHDRDDAAAFASWGIDFVEEDSCAHDAKTMPPYHVLYQRMRDALNATGRPMVFYMCVQGQDNVYQWGRETGNLWRTTWDIAHQDPTFKGNHHLAPNLATWSGIMDNFYGNMRYPNVTEVGAWQDPVSRTRTRDLQL